MSKRTVFTTISPLPPDITRQTALAFLHNHLAMIDLNPLVKARHPIPPPDHCPDDERRCAWYSLTDVVSYLPGGAMSGEVSYTAAFNDLPRGLQTHVYAPMGLDIREKWTVEGSLPGEPVRPVELGLDAPQTGLYIREDVDMRCNFVMSGFVKKTLKKAHSVLVEKLTAEARVASTMAMLGRGPAPSPEAGHGAGNGHGHGHGHGHLLGPGSVAHRQESLGHWGEDRCVLVADDDVASALPQPLRISRPPPPRPTSSVPTTASSTSSSTPSSHTLSPNIPPPSFFTPISPPTSHLQSHQPQPYQARSPSPVYITQSQPPARTPDVSATRKFTPYRPPSSAPATSLAFNPAPGPLPSRTPSPASASTSASWDATAAPAPATLKHAISVVTKYPNAKHQDYSDIANQNPFDSNFSPLEPLTAARPTPTRADTYTSRWSSCPASPAAGPPSPTTSITKTPISAIGVLPTLPLVISKTNALPEMEVRQQQQQQQKEEEEEKEERKEERIRGMPRKEMENERDMIDEAGLLSFMSVSGLGIELPMMADDDLSQWGKGMTAGFYGPAAGGFPETGPGPAEWVPYEQGARTGYPTGFGVA